MLTTITITLTILFALACLAGVAFWFVVSLLAFGLYQSERVKVATMQGEQAALLGRLADHTDIFASVLDLSRRAINLGAVVSGVRDLDEQWSEAGRDVLSGADADICESCRAKERETSEAVN